MAAQQPPHSRWILGAVILSSGIVFLDSTIVNVALPAIGRELPSTVLGTLEGQAYITSGYLAVLSAMLIIAGGREHTAPVSVSKASFKREEANPGTTEFVELADRGHGMVIDDDWQEVAETALKFVGRFAS